MILGCLDDLMKDLDKTILDKNLTTSSGHRQSYCADAPAGALDRIDTSAMTNGTLPSSNSHTKTILPQLDPADFEIEHHMLVAANKMMARGLLQLPEGFIEYHQMARDVDFLMETASRFICEPWRWFADLYSPFLTQVGYVVSLQRGVVTKLIVLAAVQMTADLVAEQHSHSCDIAAVPWRYSNSELAQLQFSLGLNWQPTASH